jgi:hypothetical protein
MVLKAKKAAKALGVQFAGSWRVVGDLLSGHVLYRERRCLRCRVAMVTMEKDQQLEL